MNLAVTWYVPGETLENEALPETLVMLACDASTSDT
jgi:hypothetical protein